VEHRFAEAASPFSRVSRAGAGGDELDALVALSNAVGADPSLTQPGGGNSSIKRRARDFAGREIEVLSVKGSGTDLATIARGGFTTLRLADLALLQAKEAMSDEDMMAFMRACMLDAREPAPSVETPLHALLPHRFIVHTHDFATQALTDTRRPEENVRAAFGDDVAYVDYVRPGFPLARALARMGTVNAPRGLVLARHGLVAWGDSARACYDNLHALINRAEAFVNGFVHSSVQVSDEGAVGRAFVSGTPPAPAARRRAAARALLPALRRDLSSPMPGGRPLILHLDDSPEALAFAGSPVARAISARGMVTPEHILRCGRLPCVVSGSEEGSPDGDLATMPTADAARAIESALARYAEDARAAFARRRPASEMLPPVPRILLLPGLGVVGAMSNKSNAALAALCYSHGARVMAAAEALGGFEFLDEADGLAIEYWSLEMAKLKQVERELAGHVALVTGGASGIGLAIAKRFAEEGAHVVIADVDGAAARAAAEAIGAACRAPERLRGVAADATSARATADAVDEAVLAFGGLDILVANAGFVAAASLGALGEEDWDRHFDVNTKGAFLAAREAAAVMKTQRRGVILFNASKGAFAPTVDNAAYASSKAAVAALARNLAAELGPDGIRVNYFNADFVDTPLMAKLIAERAQQRGVTLEAQTAAYRARNALGVGPIPVRAIAEAALFLCSPRAAYTTGGVLTIDGGIKEAMPR
jgi:rhamnose utilization protein RhaD (predicted bifunctional aldolase and dehydrogenase)/NAD(P)-dependent dehydrogenase (short-subunit alcohol dehydrogenase family)